MHEAEDAKDVDVKVDARDDATVALDGLRAELESVRPMPLTARAIAFGAFVGVTLLTFALLGSHALFTYMGLDDGGTVKELLTVTVGGVLTLLGAVGSKLFGGSG